MRWESFISVVMIVCLAASLPAGTLYVDDNAAADPGAGDSSVSDPLEDGSQAHPFDAIQEAIVAATDGNTVLVADGTYTGDGNRDIDFLGKAITVKSQNGPETCTIDCQGTEQDPHRAFEFRSQEGNDTLLSGFKILNGYSKREEFEYASHGIGYMVSFNCAAGILCRDNSSPKISDCIIEHFQNGGIIGCYSSSPLIENILFCQNYGGLIAIGSDSSPVIKRCAFIDNNCEQSSDVFLINGTIVEFAGNGIVSVAMSESLFKNCVFSGNVGRYNAGITTIESFVDVRNCTFVGNRGEKNSSFFFWSYEDVEPQRLSAIDNCIFRNNLTDDGLEVLDGKGIWMLDNITTSDCYEVNYSCVNELDPNLQGVGNIEADPMFVDSGYWDPNGTPDDWSDDIWHHGDYRLQDGSPCIDALDPAYYTPQAGETDIDGNPRLLYEAVDMGAYEAVDPYTAPWIQTNATQFDYIVEEGHAEPVEQLLQIQSVNDHDFAWSIVNTVPWLTVSPMSGEYSGDPNEVTLTMNPDGLASGIYNETIQIQAPDAINSPLEIHISLRVTGTLHVPADYPTIQDAINEAFDGETVLVADGSYTGDGNRDIDFLGKAITLRSENGPENCIIDCQGTEQDRHTGFLFITGENEQSILDGLTIQNGTGRMVINEGLRYYAGGGVFAYEANPTIKNCVFKDNHADMGASIYYGPYYGSYYHLPDKSELDISLLNCKFSNNLLSSLGLVEEMMSVVCCSAKNVMLDQCQFEGIYSDIQICDIMADKITVENSFFTGASMGFIGAIAQAIKEPDDGIFMSDPTISCVINNCTFDYEQSPYDDEPLLFTIVEGIASSYGKFRISNSLFTKFPFEDYIREHLHEFTGAERVTYSVIPGGFPGVGNINVNPQFVQSGYRDDNGTTEWWEYEDDIWVPGDYHLKSAGWRWDMASGQWTWDEVTSSCIDAGCPGASLGDEPVTLAVDPLNRLGKNVRVNMGAYGGTVEASMAPPGWMLLCDLDNSLTVDFGDFVLLAEMWLQTAEHLPADVSRDGMVGLDDLARLTEQWLDRASCD